MYDIIIIGAGPAGISASLYARRANLNVLVFYSGESELEKAEKIDNYYGFPDGITGKKLFEQGIEQAKKIGVEIIKNEVIKISKSSSSFIIKTIESEHEAKAIILSTGNKKIKPNIEGIEEFEGKGVSYCAICDAFFYRNKNVAVIGNGDFAVSEAGELSHVADRVTLLTNGLDEPKCEFEINNKKIKRIIGEKRVKGIEFEDGTSLDVDGIFIALGQASAGDFAKTLGIIQNGENIKVNDKMETNIEGIYACGNVTGNLLQVCKAVHEGAEAALSAINYVRK
ncbi:MAG: FAD-dependent oxidoreductase [Clostridia bacterium]|nr:FAD-dependent oxidoreductase [Clostridia bacterium]